MWFRGDSGARFPGLKFRLCCLLACAALVKLFNLCASVSSSIKWERWYLICMAVVNINGLIYIKRVEKHQAHITICGDGIINLYWWCYQLICDKICLHGSCPYWVLSFWRKVISCFYFEFPLPRTVCLLHGMCEGDNSTWSLCESCLNLIPGQLDFKKDCLYQWTGWLYLFWHKYSSLP